MKLHEIKRIDDSDDEDDFLTPLKDLSKHVYNGMIKCSKHDVDKTFDAARDAVEALDDVLMWHDWESDTVYDISVAAKTKDEVMKVLDAVLKANPRAHAYWCHKASGKTIEHRDWIKVTA